MVQALSPLAITTAECDEMIAACRQANVLLMEEVMYHFHPRMVHGFEPDSTQSLISYSLEATDISTSAVLRFGEDVSARIQCSFAAAEHQTIEVVGAAGAVTAPLAFTAWRDEATMLMLQRGAVFEQRVFAPDDPYLLMVEYFATCVTEGTQSLYPAKDGRTALRVLDMLRGSESVMKP